MWKREECQEAILGTGKMPSKWKLDPTAICAGGIKGLDFTHSFPDIMSFMTIFEKFKFFAPKLRQRNKIIICKLAFLNQCIF